MRRTSRSRLPVGGLRGDCNPQGSRRSQANLKRLSAQGFRVLRLHTLGGLRVVGPDDEVIAAFTAQRRPAGPASILARAGDRGSSRDKVVGLLWPDADPERARHSLTQALYAA